MEVPHAHIRTVHSTRFIKVKGRHNYHPLTLECVRCGISQRKNANVPFGMGVPCKDQLSYIEKPETYTYVAYCEKDHDLRQD